jgi:hypothetical protein
MAVPHQGIRIDHIPAEGGGGLIFALGTIFIFLIGVPPLRPVAAIAVIGGLLLAPVLHRLYR